MLKKIIISSTFIFVIGVSSCSMWDDVDKNTPYQIPVANISIDAAFTDWKDVPEFLKSDNATGTTPRINFLKIATNSARTHLYFMLNGIDSINASNYIIALSNDYTKCNGYRVKLFFDNGSFWDVNTYKLCEDILITSPTVVTMMDGAYLNFEADLEITANMSLNNIFLISVYSVKSISLGVGLWTPIGDTTNSRWVKLR
jgi:hypothetical protein